MIEPFRVGDRVEKVSGYEYPGIVVSVFQTSRGEHRVVVECTTLPGMLHIFAPHQLRHVAPPQYTATWGRDSTTWPR